MSNNEVYEYTLSKNYASNESKNRKNVIHYQMSADSRFNES